MLVKLIPFAVLYIFISQIAAAQLEQQKENHDSPLQREIFGASYTSNVESSCKVKVKELFSSFAATLGRHIQDGQGLLQNRLNVTLTEIISGPINTEFSSYVLRFTEATKTCVGVKSSPIARKMHVKVYAKFFNPDCVDNLKSAARSLYFTLLHLPHFIVQAFSLLMEAFRYLFISTSGGINFIDGTYGVVKECILFGF